MNKQKGHDIVLSPVQSSIQGISWPALPGPAAATMWAMQYQLEQSQWWSPQILRDQQFRQVQVVLKHAYRTVPYYRNRFDEAGINPEKVTGWDSWKGIPVLSRSDIQQAGDTLNAIKLPPGHGRLGEIVTSGSTGRPIRVKTTEVTQFFWQVFTLREHLWHERDFSGKLAVIRHFDKKNFAAPPDGGQTRGWGPSTDILFTTGPAVALNVRSTLKQQVDWLRKQNPTYLLIYPTLADALAKQFIATGESLPSLKEIRTLGEIVTPAIRKACRDAWGVPLVDSYSSQELGYLALQCPEHEHYHIQSENLIVEILDNEGLPCKPGETGRIVATALHNFATPLIRYEVGDYAEVGEVCSCGRGQPVITRIHGRTRNMVRLPTGELRWPVVGEKVVGLENLPAVRQYQLIQKSLEQVEVRLVMPRKLTPDEEKIMISMWQRTLGYPFAINIVYCDVIERSAGGKYEEFMSEIN